MKYMLPVLLLLSFSANAGGWTPADTKRELDFLTIAAIDIGQTLDIVEKHKQGYDYYEQNTLFLREHPSRGEVISYGILWTATHYAVARWLDPDSRYWWQVIGTGAHSVAVANNVHRGLEIDDSAKPFVGMMLTFRVTW